MQHTKSGRKLLLPQNNNQRTKRFCRSLCDSQRFTSLFTDVHFGVKQKILQKAELSDDEKEIFSRLRECYRDLLGTWSYRSKQLIQNVEE